MGSTPLKRRLLALAAAAVTLWTAAITAGSRTFSAAAQAVKDHLSSPIRLLQWELADLCEIVLGRQFSDGLWPS